MQLALALLHHIISHPQANAQHTWPPLSTLQTAVYYILTVSPTPPFAVISETGSSDQPRNTQIHTVHKFHRGRLLSP